MSNTQQTSTSGGIGFFGLFTIVLFVMKIMEVGPVATLAWPLVFAPLLAPVALVVIFITAAAVFALIASRIK